ncbi:RNA polymerase sigma factor, sigma-70 family [Singulisphaera sp. GP187]|uniref:sigma-70 family RNA polymerase sigma factor n=1 Tax=Singulisphaera sp. GP187 TaxID=1882752 RepID=UPI00092A2721|nr:sigma-70 family RNA polymerase sigma factor [Singulisphaera sp. GP187]SIO60421.1 RNA polymerase sigma factor, sigma-70 family [Singulisphaera sp. GP187]
MAIRDSVVVDPLKTLFGGGATAGLTDGQLLERFATRRGEDAELAFTALVTRHGPMVWGVCRGLLRNPHDAEDAFQAAFFVLARKAGSLRQPELVGPWLYGVALRTARQVKAGNERRRRREAEAAMSGAKVAADAGGRELTPSVREEIETLHEEIDRLPERYRTAIVLCDLQGLTHEEAARRLGRPVGTVSARISRARDRLKGRLSRRGVALPGGVLATAVATGQASAMPAALAGSTTKIAMSVSMGLTAGTVPASVAALSQGVIKTMFLTKIKTVMVTLILAGAAAGSVAVVAQQGSAPRVDAAAEQPSEAAPQKSPTTVTDKAEPREAELIVRSAANLRKIARGIHAYLDTNKRFPPPAIYSANGKPLLSWRVAILPFIGEKALYDQFKLDEPWDGPHNQGLLKLRPKVYAPVVNRSQPTESTYYQGFTGKRAFFEGKNGIALVEGRNPFPEIPDGTVSTLMVVEAGATVPWTKPEDLQYAPDQPFPKLGGQFKEGFVALTADGSTRFINRSIDPKILHAIITRNGEEVINNAAIGETIAP